MDKYQIQIEVSELDCRKSNKPMALVIGHMTILARAVDRASSPVSYPDAFNGRRATVTETTLGAILKVSFWHDEVADAAFDVLEDYIQSLEHHDRMVISPLY